MPQTNKYQYCIYNNEILELHELEDEFFRNKIQTRNKYKGHLLCPGCHQVCSLLSGHKSRRWP